MSDPFVLAAQAAAAALGMEPATRTFAAMGSREFLEWTSCDDMNALLRECERLRDAGATTIAPDGPMLRRAQLRRDLPLGVLVDVYGVKSIRLRKCLVPSPKTVRGCRCGEDAVGEVASQVSRVDPSALAAVRARAEIAHGRFVRRLERARARTVAMRRAARPAVSPPPARVPVPRPLALEIAGGAALNGTATSPCPRERAGIR